MIYYIPSCSKRLQYAKKVKELFEHSGLEYYFVYGKSNPSKLSPYIEVDCEEAYETLPLKTYYIVEHFLTKSKASTLVKLNDDTYVNTNRLKQLVLNEDYTGPFVEYPEDIKSQIFHWHKVNSADYKIKKRTFKLSYAEGSFYALSRKAASVLYNTGKDFFVNTPKTYLGEDIKVGMCLNNPDITRRDITTYKLPYYEIMDNYTAIHPVHYTLFDKIHKTNTEEELLSVLSKNRLLNDNVLREIYLQEQLKKIKHE